MTRVLIADDHPLVLRGLSGLLEDTPYDVVAVCADGVAAYGQIMQGVCEIAVLDLQMPGLSGLEILRKARQEGLTTRIVLLTATIDDADLVAAVTAGVDGLVLKETAAHLLVTCLDSVRQGAPWIDRSAMSRALNQFSTVRSTGSGTRLTGRETDVARYVAAGLRNREIAEKANITEGTVKMHLHNIYEKLGIATRTELAIHVRDVGLGS
jgi:two-component system, NarL family, nitrate/nitrite response regulator NarL